MEPRFDVAEFDNPERTPQVLSNLRSVGWINCQLQLDVLEKRRLPGGSGSEFLFSEPGTNLRVRGVSFYEHGDQNFDDFQAGYTYVVERIVRCNYREQLFSTIFNTPFELVLTQVNFISRQISADRWSGGIDEIKENLANGSTHMNVMYLKNVALDHAQLYLYTGCEFCQRSMQSRSRFCPNERCSGGPGARSRQVFMILRDVEVKDINGNTLNKIVIFNDSCERIVGSRAVDFHFDSVPTRIVRNLLGTRLHLRILYRLGSLQATVLEILGRRSYSVDAVPIEEQAQSGSNENANIGSDAYDAYSPAPIFNFEEQFVFTPLPPSAARRAERYPHTSGHVLIVNNNYFPHKDYETQYRLGSENDVTNLSNALIALGMTIFGVKRDVKSSELPGILEEFINYLKEVDGADTCIVAFMSHGVQSRIEMVDGVLMNFYTEILPYFSNSRFPEFEGNPKIFINQTCQNFTDVGLAHSTFPSDFRSPNYSDILICHPQMPGMSAVRQQFQGTAFIFYLCQFLERTPDFEIQEMVRRVGEHIYGLEQIPPQLPYCLSIRFSRQFYFQNPS